MLTVNADMSISLVYTDGQDQLIGPVKLDVSGKYWKIAHVDLNGTVEGYSVEIELQPS